MTGQRLACTAHTALSAENETSQLWMQCVRAQSFYSCWVLFSQLLADQASDWSSEQRQGNSCHACQNPWAISLNQSIEWWADYITQQTAGVKTQQHDLAVPACMREQMLVVMTILSDLLNPNDRYWQCPDQQQPTRRHDSFDVTSARRDLLNAQEPQ